MVPSARKVALSSSNSSWLLARLLGQGVGELDDQVGRRGAGQVFAERAERIADVGLGDHVQVGALRKLDVGAGEQFQVAGHPAADPPDALGDDGLLAALAGEQHEHAVGLAEVDAPQHDASTR